MKKILLTLFVLVLVVFAACNDDKTKINISSKNFEDEINRKTNLSIVFSQDVAEDAWFGKWDTTQFIQFTPPIKGKFQWKSATELVFSPAQAFPPSTDFKGQITAKVAQISDGLSLGKNTNFNFHTPYLKLENAKAFWKLSAADKNKTAIGASLQLNNTIDPKTVADKLKVTLDGNNLKYEIMSLNNTDNLQLEIDYTDINNNDLPMQFSFGAGVNVLNSNWTSKDDISIETTLDSPSNLRIDGVEAQHDGSEGRITVASSQQINSSNLKELVSINPNVPFEIEQSVNGFTLVSAAFDAAALYELKIAKRLTGIFKGKLNADFKQQIAFGNLEPSIKFVNTSANYLTPKGHNNIAVKIVNVPEIKVTTYKIFNNNIMNFLKNGQKYGWSNHYNEAGDYWDYANYHYFDTKNFGKAIDETSYMTKDLEKVGKVHLLNIDFNDKLPDFEGMYVVKVDAADKNYLTASKTFSYSDIGLIVKQNENQIHIFTNTISTAKALPSVKVSLISRTNQNIKQLVTNTNGVAVLDNIKETFPDFDISMITAEKNGDFNYLPFNKTNINTSRFDVGGLHTSDSDYQAFIYGDRDLYRPNEKMYVSTIVRNTNWKTPKDVPVKISLLLPNGKEYKTVRKTLDEQGAAETSFDLPAGTVTGTYMIEVYTANDVLLNSKPIGVEEFMPDRIKVEIEPNKKEMGVGEKIVLNGKATNLFGPPAQNRNYEVEMSLKRQPFLPKDFPSFRFDVKQKKEFAKAKQEGKTDENGQFETTFDILKQYEDMGFVKGKFYATVFDESGRPVNRIKTFDVYTQDIFYGVGYTDSYVGTRKNMKIPLVAVDKNEKVLDGVKADLKIIRYEWRTVLEGGNRNGRYRYRSQKEEIIEEQKTIKISSNDSYYQFMPSRSGEYEIRISGTDSKSYVSRKFYAYRYGDTESTSFEVNQEGKIDISFDKEEYEVGETANILFKTPFEGRMLVTLERENVLRYMYLNTDKKAAEVSIPILDEHIPNVFVSATLIRPMRELNVPLTVAHGYAPMMAKKANHEIPIKIVANEKSRSKSKQRIMIETNPNTKVTVAVVDEGILQIKDYKTPRPYDFFYQKRALAVNSHDLYPYLFPEVVGSEMLSGGDGFDLGKRVNPVENKRVKLVSLWSGILESDSRGKVDYEIDIPQFSGDLRVMAVAYKDQSFGTAETNMKIADPVVISASLPRFLSPNDTIIMPVTLSNTTEKQASANVKISASGPLSLVGNGQETATLNANSENRIEFKVVAKNAFGNGKVNVTVNALSETFENETELPVRPAGSLQKTSGSGSVAVGKTETISLNNKFVKASMDGKLLVSRSPLIEFAQDLEYLVGYPHGCVEQTISKAFPQLYVYDMMQAIGTNQRTATMQNANNPNYNVEAAIKKLEGMQLANGGMPYWSGNSKANNWGTIFAAHFFLEAEKAGFAVNEKAKTKLLNFAKRTANKKSECDYHYYESGKYQTRKIACKDIAYALYVLALAQEPNVATMNYYKSNLNKLSMDSRYLLASAFAIAGDKAKFTATLPVSFGDEMSKPQFAGSFYSPIRDRAIALNGLLEADPNHPQIGILTKHLINDYKKKRWLNTQERVFTFLAMGKIAKMSADSDATATISSKGRKIGTFSGDDLTVLYGEEWGDDLKITTSGNKGNLYYFWDIEGLTADGSYEQKDNFLKVRRTFYDRYGRVVSTPKFEQNDLIVVKLSLQSTEASVPNVVVSDILPAGLEIENPRISELPEMEWIKDSSLPEHQDFRDDRVHLFTTATAKAKDFYYMVRAVTPGRFQMGPASADAMYNGEYHSYHGGGTVEVTMKK
ncbi:MAG: alpha-2-macroglobulin family protein [Chitinophagales bacterium]